MNSHSSYCLLNPICPQMTQFQFRVLEASRIDCELQCHTRSCSSRIGFLIDSNSPSFFSSFAHAEMETDMRRTLDDTREPWVFSAKLNMGYSQRNAHESNSQHQKAIESSYTRLIVVKHSIIWKPCRGLWVKLNLDQNVFHFQREKHQHLILSESFH